MTRRVIKNINKKQSLWKKLAQKGQMTIFFALTMILIISLMAFIVSVGIFVKAKINLQNAVDAAAWSGAAVQARQLTSISYLNWEMRNVYKEWMFKYYVLGQISMPKTDIGALAQNSPMDFRLPNLDPTEPDKDFFNIPSICIHFGQAANICSIYTIPGLPRFEPVNLPGLDETHTVMINELVKAKAQDCSKRSDLNFVTAVNWAYGVKADTNNANSSSVFADAPQIALNRHGAWPIAFELALRVRNIEKILNESPKSVCIGGADCLDIQSLDQSGGVPLHERTVKAFWAAYRNLGNSGTVNTTDGPINDGLDMKNSFKLTELPPTEFRPEDISLSSALIPSASDRTKRYIDLRVYLLNLVTFYSAFVSQTKKDASVPAEAACSVTKVALPVPGYPFGFEKNPEIMTYYAVKGEANFTGLFFPFTNQSVKLTAYAAAKPFGGRIGPKLFALGGDNQSVKAREDAQSRSFSYLTGVSPDVAVFTLGYPMPIAGNFWVQNPNDTVGGLPQSGSAIKFAIPNMIYDTVSEESITAQIGGGSFLQSLSREPAPNLGNATRAGLYDSSQFLAFKNNLLRTGIFNPGDPTLSSSIIDHAILSSRAPTKYEALNYLIPNVRNEALDPQLETPAYIQNIPDDSGEPIAPIQYQILAPLFGAGTHFPGIEDIRASLNEYVNLNSGAVDTYTQALEAVANQILADSRTLDFDFTRDLYVQAARTVHTPDLDCNSLAGKFVRFFNDDGNSGCPVNLRQNIIQSWNNRNDQNPLFQNYFRSSYVHPSSNTLENRPDLMTAFMPGVRQGATLDAIISHPFFPGGTNKDQLARRNFYSTKFISFKNVASNNLGGFAVYSEGTNKQPSDINAGVTTLRNPLNVNDPIVREILH